MRRSEIEHSRISVLRKRITALNKALRGARARPGGLSRLTIEDINHELQLIQAEIRKRKTP